MTEFFTPEKDKQSPNQPGTINEELPSVLIIGDSISQGYTWPVRDLLAGQFNVDRPRANCGDTRAGLEKLDTWLDEKDWDLIHFNWGLHDLCYRHAEEVTVYGNRDKINGSISVPLDEYRINLEKLVERLAATGSRLIWASTTFVPADEPGRYQGDDVRYNEAAAEIMEKHGIPINDLHALTAPFGPSMYASPGDAHFSDEGMQKIIEQVEACIKEQLT
jgi:lysophospholipase L1-like esterase